KAPFGFAPPRALLFCGRIEDRAPLWPRALPAPTAALDPLAAVLDQPSNRNARSVPPLRVAEQLGRGQHDPDTRPRAAARQHRARARGEIFERCGQPLPIRRLYAMGIRQLP